tara:strand:+ start:54 stop:386 length:333 start_codon:yes stop_codon:yes gene_type:complete
MTRLFGRAALLTVLLVGAQAFALDDPTRPYTATMSGSSDQAKTAVYQLGSILISDQRRVAVINGHPKVVGDRIGQAKVTRIGVDRVELSVGGKSQILRWQPTLSIKKPTK